MAIKLGEIVLVYIILILMIISNFNWLFKRSEIRNICSRKAYVEESHRIVKETKSLMSESDGESSNNLVFVLSGITLLIALVEITVALVITKNFLLIPFCLLMIVCEVYESKYVVNLYKGKVTYTADTISHAILIYRRLFYMNLTINVALAIF